MPSQESIEIRKTIIKDELREDIPIQQKRLEWEEYARSLPLPSGIKLENVQIAEVPCLWVHPENSNDEQVIVYMHGGGLVEGSAATTQVFAARLAKTTGYSVLVVEYRLAPEHPFPAALHDITAVYKALIMGRFQPEQIAFGGDSSGGGLALATLIALRDEQVSLPESIFLLSPVLDQTCSGESMVTRADIDLFTAKDVLMDCAEQYAQGADLKNPLISPLFADLSGLPPILLQVGDHEILLSDSVRLAEKEEANATLKVWDSMWHVWQYYTDLPEAQQALEEISDFLESSQPA